MNRPFTEQWLGSLARAIVLVSAALALAQCSPLGAKYADPPAGNYSDDEEQVSRTAAIAGRSVVGKPYTVRGRTYVPAEDPAYRVEGIASWYGPDFHGGLTANGERYDMNGISAAHPTMPLPSYARVTNLDNGRSMIVRVNNRGPFVRNRLVDLSVGAARALDFYSHGTARVRVEYVGRAPREAGDERMLLATLREGTPAPAPSKVMVASAKPFLPKVKDEGR